MQIDGPVEEIVGELVGDLELKVKPAATGSLKVKLYGGSQNVAVVSCPNAVAGHPSRWAKVDSR